MIPYKKCSCDEDSWEEIVVHQDENYGNKKVVYLHCKSCGEDFRVQDFETGEELFFKKLLMPRIFRSN